MKSEFKRHSEVGHGGFGCPCCAPQSGNRYKARARVIMKRQAKRKLNQFITKQIHEEGEAWYDLRRIA